jgi:hypothetical protein
MNYRTMAIETAIIVALITLAGTMLTQVCTHVLKPMIERYIDRRYPDKKER